MITASGGTDNNYDFSYVNGSLTVTKAMLTATAQNASRAYGDANPALSLIYTGFKNGETNGVIDVLGTATTAAIATSNVGSYTITAAGASDNNYDFTFVDGSLTINKATLTATAQNATRIYGDANPALSIVYTGFKNGETNAVIDVLGAASTTANNTTNVGSHAITASGASDGNYDFNYVDGNLSITKATLTATVQNVTREYGDANPAFHIVYTGFKNAETNAVIDSAGSASTVATLTSNVGSYAITGSGATDNNYSFTYVDGSLSITKATLTATAQDATRIYGDANPALNIVYSGFKNNENSGVIDVLGNASTGAIATSNVGNYTISAVGASDGNYNFTYVDGNLSITKATLTATAQDATRIYGDANPALTVVYTGFKNGENSGVIDVLGNVSTGAIVTSNVGNYTITAAGASDNNYDFTYVNGNLSITKATLTATAQNATREYGDANPSFSVVYTGFKNGENDTVINTLANVSTAATVTTNVGSHAITASAAIDNNYDFTYIDGNLTITKAMLTATAQDATRIYGDANPALSIVYTGFKNGETSAVIDSFGNAATGAIATSNVGNYAITASGAADGNYDFTYVDGNLSITKATLTAAAQNATREYGDANPALNIVYTGFKNGENSGVIDSLGSASTAAIVTSNVGSYTITAAGASDGNYDFAYVDGSLSITKATLTATAQNTTRKYGDANPILSIIYTGFKNSETSAVIDSLGNAATAAIATTNVGSYAITASGASDGNYDFAYVDGNLSITKAMLTATAQNATREYGDANPALTVAYTGFKNGETSAVIDGLGNASTAAIVTSNVGSYVINAAGASDGNYDFTYVDGNLSITKATLTATAQNATREYGDANPALNIVYTGFKNSENDGVIDSLGNASTGAIATSNVGNYAITASGASDGNYNFVYVNGNLSITKATLTATAQNATREYGDANPALNIVYTGFKNGENNGVIDALGTASTTAIITSNVGSYVVAASGASDGNYNFNYVDGNLSITKAMLTATAQNATREYGDANPALTVAYTGFKNGENSGVIDVLGTASTTANVTSNVGGYTITASGANDGNYDFTYVDGNLTVTKATLTATAQNATREYGDANPALNIVYAGFKNSENDSVINSLGSANTIAIATSNVGNYAVTASGAADNNYDFVYVNGNLSVTKAMLTATAQNATREYGDANPALNIVYTGFKNGENNGVINVLASASSGTNTASNAGAYTITASGASDNNYDFTYVSGSLTVSKATLTATAQNASRDYGDANPTLNIAYTGFKNGQNSSVIDVLGSASTIANATSNVGTYTISASGASDNNYNFVYNAGTLTIDKATITVTGQNATRIYGDANPVLGINYTGFKNGETSAVLDILANVSTSATILSNTGNYAVSVTGASDNNYDFTYVNGNLGITKALLTATAQDATRHQYQNDPVFTVVYAGFKNGENELVINNHASTSTVADIFSAPGMYSIVASGALDNNYAFNYVSGVLTVDAPITPPPPIPEPAPNSGVPNTVNMVLEDTLSRASYLSLPTMFDERYLDRFDKDENGSVIIVPDDLVTIDKIDDSDFLIAMTESLQQMFVISWDSPETRP